ncbi:hypothetical protein RIB2604_00900660 [Aspergillus luchuensis]|uniref:Uncharacterized protein n=1 Tax=Aspergillus kawachii TaxID=1069201 RepID=A0A146F4L4_ASPKA|nr:hypothetical protein RIB2604_00900660 [Aspergillus luchuensis]
MNCHYRDSRAEPRDSHCLNDPLSMMDGAQATFRPQPGESIACPEFKSVSVPKMGHRCCSLLGITGTHNPISPFMG